MIYAHTRSHEPENQARRYWDEASTPLFPFGHGLSYGRFDYANLTVEPPAITTGGTVTVSVDVTNTADREADEVVQLYIHQRHGSASRPVRELKGFRRVTLAAGESRTVQFPVGPGRAALLERGRPRLGDRRLDLRRLGRRRLHSTAVRRPSRSPRTEFSRGDYGHEFMPGHSSVEMALTTRPVLDRVGP